MNRSAAVIGIGVLAIAVVVGVILFLQLPSPDTPPNQARAPVEPAPTVAAPPPAGGAPAPPAVAPAPARSGAAGPAGPMAPTFDVVRVDKKGNVVIAGKAEPDCTITVRDGDTVVGSATSDRRGDWVIVPGEPLSAGESQLGLSAKCADSAPVVADRVVVLIVPERAGPAELRAAERGIPAGAEPASPAAADTGRASATAPGEHPPAGAGTSAGERAIIVAIPRDVTKPGEVMQAPAAPPGSVTVGSIDYDDRGQVVVSGKAVPDSVLQVYLDNRIVGQAQAGPDGNWRLTPDMAIPPGKYTLRVDQVTVQGKVVARAEIPFLRGEPLADLPAGRIVVIQPGDYLWKIARASYGSGTRYTLIFEANRGQISDPDLIYPGQVFTLPRVN